MARYLDLIVSKESELGQYKRHGFILHDLVTNLLPEDNASALEEKAREFEYGNNYAIILDHSKGDKHKLVVRSHYGGLTKGIMNTERASGVYPSNRFSILLDESLGRLARLFSGLEKSGDQDGLKYNGLILALQEIDLEVAKAAFEKEGYQVTVHYSVGHTKSRKHEHKKKKRKK